MLDTVYWKKGRYLIPIFIPFLTYFFIYWMDGDNEYLGEDEIGIILCSGLLLILTLCTVFTKPNQRFNDLCFLVALGNLCPTFLVQWGLLDSNFYSDIVPHRGPYFWFHNVGVILFSVFYSLKFYYKPKKNIIAVLKLLTVLSLASIFIVFNLYLHTDPLSKTLIITVFAGIPVLLIIHAIEMLQWEKEKEYWLEELEKAAIGREGFPETIGKN